MMSVSICYEVWSQEALEAGETDDRGIEREEDYTAEDIAGYDDRADFLHAEIVRNLRNYCSLCGSHGSYHSCDDHINYSTGERTVYSVLLLGFEPSDLTYIEHKLGIRG